MGKSHHDEVRDILQQQKQLKQARGKVSPFLDKKIFIVSGDFIVREHIKAHLETLGLYGNVKTTNSPYEVPKNLKKNLGSAHVTIVPLFESVSKRVPRSLLQGGLNYQFKNLVIRPCFTFMAPSGHTSIQQ